MNRHQALSISFARTRCGRALLHGMCLVRGRNLRWHLDGIVRELFSRQRTSGQRSHRSDSQNLAAALFLGALLTGVGAASASAATEATTFTLLPVATVDGNGVFLHQINMKVEVLADGLPGQMVRVRNPKTKREFYAKVQDEQTVLINL